MRYSKLFGKTSKTVQTDGALSHTLLTQGGYICESTAGRYYFLPLGWRVMQNITRIIKEEMDAIGSQEMITPTLHPLELWQETNRTSTTGFELMKVKDRRDAEFALGGTAEEMFVDLVRKFNISYRDLPFHLYQFSTKFRDEMRARGGLLRVREFVMKDAYSFDADERAFKAMYQIYRDAYTRIFTRLGLQTDIVESDNGYIGGEYCHEYIVRSPVGESTYLVTEDGSYAAHVDVARFMREPANEKEQAQDRQIIAQPKWVMSMTDNMKHYGLPANHYLKNVVYKNTRTGKIIIATLTGDLDVNKTKLEHAIDAVGQLEEATDDDLRSIGTRPGYVHSWGYQGVITVADIVLTKAKNLIGGQKEDETDTIHVNYGRDFTCDVVADIALARAGHRSVDGKSLMERRGIEVGNIFQLGLHYTTLMRGAEYVDTKGDRIPFYMGCYGIGLGRSLATVVEVYHDDKGIVWPSAIAPYHVHLVGLDLHDATVQQTAEHVYEELRRSFTDQVLYDDREGARAGEKFADADLIGCPFRIVVSKRTKDQVEVKSRTGDASHLMSLTEAIAYVRSHTSSDASSYVRYV